MSSEETELTFVRCPSCRSLVPAVATRCRMCGFQFDGSGEQSSPPKAAPEQQSKSRVRQNTVTLDDQEVSTESSEEPNHDHAIPEDKASQAALPEREGSRHIAPSDVNAALSGSPSNSKPSTNNSSKDSESSSSEDAQNPEGAKRKRRRRRKKRPAETELNLQNDSIAQEPSSIKEEKSAPAPKVEQHKKIEEENKVIKEKVSMNTKVESTQKAQATSEGILVGWLVNYEQDSKGASIEIRAGKYFVARQRLRDGDLVIPDTAISTPHCLVQASRGAMQIQDLMSEQGTFIKKKGSNSFVPVKDIIAVEHGDSIRLGAYEVVVCLVP